MTEWHEPSSGGAMAHLSERSGLEPQPDFGDIPFIAVSIPKLVVFSLLTFGLYPFFWQYRNWKRIADVPGYYSISPGWRAVFGIFYCIKLFQFMEEECERRRAYVGFDAGTLAFVWIALVAPPVFARAVLPEWAVTMSSFLLWLPLAIAQRDVNGCYARFAPAVVVERLWSRASLVPGLAWGALTAMVFGTSGWTPQQMEELQARAVLVANEYFRLRAADDATDLDTLLAADRRMSDCDWCAASPQAYRTAVGDSLGAIESFEPALIDVYSSGTRTYVWLAYMVSYANARHGEVSEAVVLRFDEGSPDPKIEAVEVSWGCEGENHFYLGWGASSCWDTAFDPVEDCPCAWGPAVGLPVCEG